MSEKKRNIIVIGSAYPLRGGGIATFNERLAQALMDQGDNVVIHSFSLQYPKMLFPGKTQLSNDTPPENLNIEVTINSVNPFNWFKVGRKIKRLRPEIVLVRFWIPFMGPSLGTIARIIKSNNYTAVIALADNIIPHEWKPGQRIFTRYFIKSVEGFIIMSKSVLKDLELFDKVKPRQLCPHPLYDNYGEILSKEEAKKALNLNADQHYILFFGFIREYKGLDILLEALADERLRKLPVKLLIAGEFYANESHYMDTIKRLGLSEDVIIHSVFIPHADVRKYFCASDVVVLPYKDATQSGVTQVAYHFNRPVITTNVGGLPEMVPDGVVGYVVNPEPDSVAEAIYKFFNEKKETEFSENVKIEKRKYSWDVMIQSINCLAEEIINLKP
ncbi:MAG: glycosyltransferase [Bacteroidetes bacterium]|nr:glycosyltransferase [Bacteroidota bacterium]